MSDEEAELKRIIGKRVSGVEWSKRESWELLNLESISFDDGTKVELKATDYDNVVMATVTSEDAQKDHDNKTK